jgi:cysteinyl-tRNA synthetase
MKLYNTLTKTVDEFKPINPPKATIYTCGPTVYDYAHIGHWFNYIRMDMLIRTLKLSGYDTTWVMNITDVGHLVSDADEGEDKLEKGARREGKTAWEVAEFYTKDFLGCMQQLNILTPDHIPRATEHIKEQIELIKTLESKGYTYVISDGVYYDTSKFKDYASFAQLDLEGQQAGARVNVNEEKRNQTDFALWKFSPKLSDGDDTAKKRDMEWDSPWGVGFPGWHIECSAMSMKYLGETLDIHTGGIDHVPVHHTNEIAQSEAATGKRFANFWLHSNHVMVDGEKISKSLGNGIRLQEIGGKGIAPEVVRLHVLESHYRGQSHFNLESLQAATNRIKNIQAAADLRFQEIPGEIDKDLQHDLKENFISGIREALENDLNTPQALAVLSAAESGITERYTSGLSSELSSFLDFVNEALGIDLRRSVDITDEQKNLIRQRNEARGKQDWAESDRIRDVLAKQNIGLRDTPAGAIWYRIEYK